MRLLVTLVAVLNLCAVPAGAAEVRVALVIGISTYRSAAPLTNPAKDARLVAQALRETGFAVTEVIDADFTRFGQALGQFRDKADSADVALIYYAGHGVEVNGTNWLLPASVVANAPDDLQFEAVRSAAVVDAVRNARKIRLVILDACRNNPFAASRGWTTGARSAVGARGLAREASGNVVVLMATQPGATAADGAGKPNSPFAAALAKLMQEPALRLSSLPGRVSRDVRQRTGFEQTPDQQGIFDEPDWMFVPGTAPPSALAFSASPTAASDLELAGWELCSRSQTAAPCLKYRARYPSGRYAELAAERIEDLASPPRGTPVPAQAPVSSRPEVIGNLGIIVRRDTDGLRISTVQPDMPAQGRVFGGDLIVRINGEPVDPTRDANQIFAEALAGKSAVRLTIQRGVTQITAILRP